MSFQQWSCVSVRCQLMFVSQKARHSHWTQPGSPLSGLSLLRVSRFFVSHPQ